LEAHSETRRPGRRASCSAGRDVGAKDTRACSRQEFRVEPRTAADGQHRRPEQLVGEHHHAPPELLAEQPGMERRRAPRPNDLVLDIDGRIEEIRLNLLVRVVVEGEYADAARVERKGRGTGSARPWLGMPRDWGATVRTD